MPGGYGLVLGGLSLSFSTVLSLTLQCGPPCETVTTCDDKGVWPPDPQNGLSNSHAFLYPGPSRATPTLASLLEVFSPLKHFSAGEKKHTHTQTTGLFHPMKRSFFLVPEQSLHMREACLLSCEFMSQGWHHQLRHTCMLSPNPSAVPAGVRLVSSHLVDGQIVVLKSDLKPGSQQGPDSTIGAPGFALHISLRSGR